MTNLELLDNTYEFPCELSLNLAKALKFEKFFKKSISSYFKEVAKNEDIILEDVLFIFELLSGLDREKAILVFDEWDLELAMKCNLVIAAISAIYTGKKKV